MTIGPLTRAALDNLTMAIVGANILGSGDLDADSAGYLLQPMYLARTYGR